MAFLAEMLAVMVVWLSSFALCQFGVATESHVRKAAAAHTIKTVARSPRDQASPPAMPSATISHAAPHAD